ncbi:MAG: arsR [Cytophagaceae bacterium]|jgi:ArsR family transcriptional regulator|nr:arsR [Cytophagaceae bacterium]
MIRIKHTDISKGAEIYKALSDESRIRILHLILKNKEMCISDLELILDFTQTKTSRHLTYLKNNGLIRHRKTDQWVYYYINDSYHDIITKLFSFFTKDPVLQKDINEYRTLYSNNELAIRKLHSKLNKYIVPEL